MITFISKIKLSLYPPKTTRKENILRVPLSTSARNVPGKKFPTLHYFRSSTELSPGLVEQLPALQALKTTVRLERYLKTRIRRTLNKHKRYPKTRVQALDNARHGPLTLFSFIEIYTYVFILCVYVCVLSAQVGK